MPIDLNGSFTLSGGSTFNIASSSTNPILNIDSSGSIKTPQQIGFIAGWTYDPGWLNLTHATHLPLKFDGTNYNAGLGYNTTNGRFTAPYSGTYFFHGISYYSKSNPSTIGPYIYLWFAKNGSGNYLDVKIRGYANTAYVSGEIAQFTYLNAGDYIEYVVYSGATDDTTFQIYPYYGHFEGYLVG